jgi:ubiquinone/menaquinone biosynthesis C-methylase UbiE
MQEREWAVFRLLRSEKIKLEGLSVLEVGCGSGHILQRFLEFGSQRAAGIDLMESRIETGKKSYPNLHLAIGNAAQLPYANDSFDMVTQFMCLSSVLDPLMREEIANEMWRVLRPGGTILCYDLRPAPYGVGLFFMPYYALRKILGIFTSRGKKIPSAGEKTHHSTPIRPIPITEVKKMFSRGVMRYSAVSLNFNLCRIAGKSFFLATILSCVPFLRTHYLALIRKPA